MAPFSWSRWLRSFVRPPVKAFRRPRRTRRLDVEPLETRLAPATFVWSGLGKDNHWSTGANWFGGVAPSGSLDDLVFPHGVPQKATVDDISGTGSGNPTFNSITIADSYTLSGNIPLTLANPSGSGSVIVTAGSQGVLISIPVDLAATTSGQFFTVNNGADLTLTKALTGVAGSELDKDGAGLLVLNEDGSGFEGSVDIVPNGGILQVKTANALGDPAGGLTTTVGTNAQLQVNSLPARQSTIQENLVLNGSGIKTDGALLNVAGTNTWAGTVTIDSDVSFGSSAGNIIISGTISDLGAGHSVTKEGPGMVTFGTANSYRGTTTVNNGILRIQNALSLGQGDGTPATAAIVNQTETTAGVVVAAGTLQLDDPSRAHRGFTVSNHLLTLNGFGSGNVGALDNNQGANTWTGDITFGTPLPSVTDVYIGAQIPDPPYTLTLTGLISQPPSSAYTFTKVGQGTVILTHPNVYTGNTVVAAGILEITDSQALGNTPLCTVELGATLQLSVTNKTTDSVTGLANELNVSTPLHIQGLGLGNVGALYSESGINTYSGTITLWEQPDNDDFPVEDGPGADADDYAGIGVAKDPNETNGPAYLTSDFSLTVTGNINGTSVISGGAAGGGEIPMKLVKEGDGNLILPNPNLGLTSPIEIQNGWITAQDNNSLGTRIPGLGDTSQPTVTVDPGAALHLDPLSGNLTISQNLVLAGMGINHLFGQLNQQGAVENLAGINTLSGNVVLKGQVGIGVEDVFGVGSQLRMTGEMSERAPVLNIGAGASGTSAENDNIIDTGSNSGVVTVNYNMYYIPDTMDIYYGIKGGGGVLIASTGGPVSGSGTLTATYGPGASTIIEIVMDAGGGPPGTVWTYTGTITPTSVGAGGITKLGSQRLVLQGDGTYTGPVDIKQGVLLDQNNSALGDNGSGAVLPKNTVTVEDGAALELGNSTPQTNGGLQVGLNTWGEHLILNGNGDPAFGDAPLTVLSPDGAHNPVNIPIVSTDQTWRGPITLNTSAAIQVPTDSRLNVFGVIDDATNPSPAGSDLTFQGGGGLNLASADTYRGVTNATQGYVTLQNGLALGGSATPAIQTLTFSGAKSGTTQYKLSFGGSTTVTTLTFGGNDAAAIQAALNALPSVTSQGGVVTVTGAANSYTITFGGNLTGFHQPQLVATKVAGPGTLTVDTTQDGSGGVIVSSAASLQLQGGITVAGKPVVVQGTGLPSTPNTPLQWFNVGPAPQERGQDAGRGPVTGRVTGIATDPTDPNVIYIATAGGGAWKTMNGGQTWIQLFDASYAMFGGAIAVAPSDPRVIYYGTGEANNGFTVGVNDSFAGTGLYMSTDSGRTWSLVQGLPPGPANPLNGLSVSAIAVDPKNAGLVYVATSDLQTHGEFQAGAPSTVGVWRFNGAIWFNMTQKPSVNRDPRTAPKAGAPNTPGPDDDWRLTFPQQQATWSDVKMMKSGILYAALGTDIVPATGLPDPANGVYWCINPAAPLPDWNIGDGIVDSESANEFPTNLVTGNFIEGNIKITVFTDPSITTDTIYAAVAQTSRAGGGLWGIWTAVNLIPAPGLSWAAIANQPPNYMGFQGFFDSAIYTPDGAQLYVGGQESDPTTHAGHVYYTPDGGATASWLDISVDSQGQGPHTDEHALTMDASGNIIDGNDGGVWRWNPASGAQTWTDINGNLSINTVHGVAVDPTNLNIIYEGSQDNGIAAFTGSKGWNLIAYGDGGLVRVDPLNPSTVYHVQNGSLWKSTTGATTDPNTGWTDILDEGGTLYFPFVVDQVNPQRLLAGNPVGVPPLLQESTDGGTTWNDLGAPINVSAIGIATYQGTFQADPGFPLVTDQGPSTDDPNTIYITDGSSVYLTKNRGASWVNRTTNLPTALSAAGTIAHIEVDPRNRDTVYVVNNGPPDLAQGRVFVSFDAGQTWEDISHTLPDVPVWTLVIDPRNGALYAGTDEGVFVSADGGGDWAPLGSGMPSVLVWDLALNQNLNTLTAGTDGRGVWQIALSDVRAGAGALNATSGNNVWAGPVLLSGATSVGAEGTQNLQNGLATASLNIVGTISDLTAGSNPRLTKVGQGNVIFSGANTYGGVTEVAVGRLIVHNPMALGATGNGTVVDNDAALQLQSSVNGEPLTLNGNGPRPGLNGHDTGSLENVSGNNTYSGPIVLASNATIGVDTNSTLTVTGVIDDQGHNFALAKELTGTLVLTAANTYGGGTTIDQGAINIQNGQALGDPGTLTSVLDGAQLQLQGGITVPSERLRISGTGIVGTGALEGVGGANDWQGPITLAQDPGFLPATNPPSGVGIGVLLGSPGDSLTIDGTIGQAVGTTMGLTKVGPGILVLTGANTYDGVTTVAAGALRLQNGSALGTVVNGTVVQTGAAVELDGDPTNVGASITVSGESLTLNGNGTPEVQRIDVSGTAGSFTLNFKGQTTTALGFNATPAQVAAALNKLSTITAGGGSVSVAEGTPGIYLVTFQGGLSGAHQPLLVANGSGGTTVGVSLLRDGGAGALHDISGNDSWVSPVTLASATSIGVDPGLQLTVSGPVQDPATAPIPAASLSKVGAGTLIFPGVNSYTGKTFVNSGILNIQAGTQTVGGTVESPLGAVVNEVQTVAVSGPSTGSFTLTFNFNGKFGTTASLPATIPPSGGVGPTASLQNALNALASIGGVSGSVTVTKSGSTFTITFGGTLAGTNVSQLTGVGSNGTILTIKTVKDGSEGTVVASGATLQLQGGITMSSEALTLNGNGFNGLGALDSAADSNTWATPITLGSNTSVGADAGATLTLGGVISESSAGTALTKVGPGIAVLSGPASNAYTGLTTVSNGTLELAKTGGALAVIGNLTVGNGTSAPGSEVAQLELPNQIAPSKTVTVLSDGVFDLNGQQQTVGALSMTGGAVTLGGPTGQLNPNGPVTATSDAAGNPATISGAGTVNLGSTTRTITVNGPAFAPPAVADLVISSQITGTGTAGLTKAGTGVLQLTNNETYPGTTTVTQGTLLADAPTGATVGAVLLAGGTVGGTGQVGNITPFSSGVGGTVKPGDGTGIPGNLTTVPGGTETWNPATTLFLTIMDATAGDFATLSVKGNINLGGAQLAGFIGPGLKIGDSYTILTATGGTISGRFAEPFGEVTPGGLGIAFVGGQKFLVDYSDPTKVVLTAIQQTATVALSSSVNPSVYGQDVVFTATMTPEPGAGNVPGTDTVTFTLDGGAVTFTAPVVNNKATFDPLAFFGQPLSVGSHNIDATFNGDSKFAPATAQTLKQTVNQASTSVSLSNSPANPIPAQVINVTATLSPVAPGGGVPTGTATFTLDGVIVSGSTVPLNAAGEAVFHFTSPTAGTHRIRVTYSGDTNFKPVSTSSDYLITVAKGTPTITITPVPLTSVYSQSVIFTATVSGPLIPTGSVSFYQDTISAANNLGTLMLNSSGVASVTTSAVTAGTHQIIVTYSGDPSYLNSQNAISFTVVPATTDTSLTASGSVVAFGSAVKFTASVSVEAPGTATPNGQVEFLDGSAVLGFGSLTAAGVATFGTTGLTVGNHSITAQYVGNGNFSPSTSTPVAVLVQVGTLVTVTSSANPAFFGQPITLTAKLKAIPPGTGSPAAGETVNFYDGLPGSTLLASNVPIDGTGTASIITSSLSVGTHTISVTFDGDSIFLAGNGSMKESIIRSNTTTALTSSGTPSVFGQGVTFSASVAAKAPGGGTPTGTVKFYDGAATPTHLLATGTLNGSGVTTFTTSTLSSGPHTIIAVYGGDTNYTTSQASTPQVVNKDSTTTAVSGPSGSVFGQTVSFTAAVSANAPGGGVPSGLVTFTDIISGTPRTLGTATLKGGVAVFGINSLSVGPHNIMASYAGDNNFTASVSTTPAPLTVSRDTTTPTVTSSANPSLVGKAVTYTVVVASDAPGSGIPTGTVTFFDGGVRLGPDRTLSAGKATFVTGPLSFGIHNITATYNGSPNYFGSTSATWAQGVFYPDTVNVTAVPGTTVVFGQTLSFNVTVAAGSPSPGVTPTGTVDFLDGSTDLSGPVSLDATGSASFTVPSALAVGKHNITVAYSGDTNYITNSAVKPITVNKDGTTTSVAASTPTSIYGLPVDLTASVAANAPGSGTPGGTVTFWDGAINTGLRLGSVALSGGQAVLTVSTLGASAAGLLHNINVSYAGDGSFTASNTTTPAQVTVSQATTSTTISGPASPVVYGQAVNFVATVSLTSGGGTPVGSVKFYDQSVSPATLLGTVSLVGGTATLPISTLPVGTHSVQAVYVGTSNYAGSSTDITLGTNADLTVNQDNTSVQLTSSANPLGSLQPVTFKATVVPAAPGSGAATGTATFMDGSTVLGTAKVVGGVALLTISNLAVGDHDISVSYSGDGNFIGSNSNHLTQTVRTQSAVKVVASVSWLAGAGVGRPFTISVIAEDAAGNRVFSDFEAVSIILLAPAPGALLSNGKPVGQVNGSFTNGLAVFGNFTVTGAGRYNIKVVTASGLTTTFGFDTGGRQF
jgi:autotransporter-associated beta strand protein